MANNAGGVMPQASDKSLKMKTNYDSDISKTKSARNNQLRDTDPRIEKEGFLGIDDLDRMRRKEWVRT